MARTKKEVAKATKATKAKKKTNSKLSDEDIKTLQQIESQLLKKSKATGTIEQNDIWDALNAYEIEDDVVEELMAFFKENNIEVINEDDEEEEEEEEDFDESKMNLEEDPDDAASLILCIFEKTPIIIASVFWSIS